jgi:4-carboxymuconolactone decarboxylase
MTEAERSLVRLSAAIASRDPDRLGRALDEAAARATPLEIEEALLQSYLFLGYPAALWALGFWRERSPVPVGAGAAGDAALWRERGEAVCARVYGGQYGRLRENVARLHPDVERWMLVEGYGKVLGRPGLSLRTRELCIVALLVGQDARPQLYAHLRGALNAGASAEDVSVALAVATDELGPERGAAALEVWRGLSDRREGGATGAMESTGIKG